MYGQQRLTSHSEPPVSTRMTVMDGKAAVREVAREVATSGEVARAASVGETAAAEAAEGERIMSSRV